MLCVGLMSTPVWAQRTIEEYNKLRAKEEEKAKRLGTVLLPNIKAQVGKKQVEVSFYTLYDRIQSVALQRSNDSSTNFKTIAYLKNLGKGKYVMPDKQPALGQNFYRMIIVFDRDITWYSNKTSLSIDSVAYLSLLGGGYVNPKSHLDTVGNPSDHHVVKKVMNTTDPFKPNFVLVPSPYVKVDPFTRQIEVEVEGKHGFFNEFALEIQNLKGEKGFNLPSLPRGHFVLDYRNINAKGILRFVLKKKQTIFSKGFISL